MNLQDELISVIVPAYNAEPYIARTLESILRQTHQNIEVIVVDDGSKDSTNEIVRAYVEADNRVILIQQSNGGVARARNNGIRHARGALIAPCDADDLWSPEKLEKQLSIYRAGGAHMALVYAWAAVINDRDIVMNYDHHPSDEGWVFDRMCKGNLIGNGSSTLMSKEAVLKAGGYDPSLRDRGAQGCEDFKLYLQLSIEHTFGVMREYGVGYRHTPENMSSDIDQMLRSYSIVIDEFIEEYPERRKQLKNGYAELIDWFRLKALSNGQWRAFFGLQVRLMSYDFLFAMKSLRWGVVYPLLRRLKWALRKRFMSQRLDGANIIPGSHKFIGDVDEHALHRIGKWPQNNTAIARESNDRSVLPKS